MSTDAMQLACDHWGYIESLLVEHGEPDHLVKIVGFHYKSAFEHGYKHAKEIYNVTKEIPYEPISEMDKINCDLPKWSRDGLLGERAYIRGGGGCGEVQEDNPRQERGSGCSCGESDCK